MFILLIFLQRLFVAVVYLMFDQCAFVISVIIYIYIWGLLFFKCQPWNPFFSVASGTSKNLLLPLHFAQKVSGLLREFKSRCFHLCASTQPSAIYKCIQYGRTLSKYDTRNREPYKNSKANEYNFVSYIDIMFSELHTYITVGYNTNKS